MSKTTIIVIVIVVIITMIALIAIYINSATAAAKLQAYNQQQQAIAAAQQEQNSIWDYLQGIPGLRDGPCFSEMHLPNNLKSKKCQQKGDFDISSNSLLGMFF